MRIRAFISKLYHIPEGWVALLFYIVQLIRLRLDYYLSLLKVGQRKKRVIATACLGFSLYSHTFVYQELCQLIRNGFTVKFLYSHLNRGEPFSYQFMLLWRAKRRLFLHPLVCRPVDFQLWQPMPGLRLEVIDHGITGFMTPQRDENALAQSVEELIRNPRLREEMSRRAANKVRKKFDVTVCEPIFHSCLAEVLKKIEHGDLEIS